MYERAASAEKDLYIIEGASHYDLYDNPVAVNKAVTRQADFYHRYLK